jgi:hypothetical protein
MHIAVSGNGAVIYAINYDYEILVSKNTTFAPIVAPTVSPTRAPTTSKPSLAPVVPQPLTTGWLYADYYVNNATQSDCATSSSRFAGTAPDFVHGIRLGVCHGNDSYLPEENKYGVANWFSYSCSASKQTYQVNLYSNKYCSGTPYKVDEYPIASGYSRFDDDETPTWGDGSIESCSQMTCTENDYTLPLLPFQPYTVFQDFVNYVPVNNSCVNSQSFEATLNYKCITTSESSSIYLVYPYFAVYYSNPICEDGFSFNSSIDSGCHSNFDSFSSNSVATAAIEERVILSGSSKQVKTFVQSLARGHIPSVEDMFKRVKSSQEPDIVQGTNKLPKEPSHLRSKTHGEVSAASLYIDDYQVGTGTMTLKISMMPRDILIPLYQ